MVGAKPHRDAVGGGHDRREGHPDQDHRGLGVQRRSDAFIDRLSRGSTLFRNNGDGTFTDVSDAAGVRDAQWGWGAEFFDYDDDGALDLYAVNGFLSGPIPDDL